MLGQPPLVLQGLEVECSCSCRDDTIYRTSVDRCTRYKIASAARLLFPLPVAAAPTAGSSPPDALQRAPARAYRCRRVRSNAWTTKLCSRLFYPRFSFWGHVLGDELREMSEVYGREFEGL